MDAELLIGFDAREMWLAFDSTWPAGRKETYLLRDDVEKPFSTDIMVWQSVLEADELERPAWIGPVQEMWDSLERLKAFLAAEWKQPIKPYHLIAVTRFVDSYTKSEMQQLYQIQPPERYPAWTLLGYDVSDQWLLSGLLNCGYWPDEIEALRERWAAHLNEHHLFTDRTRADQFRMVSDERVKEHAPFFVYGLYLVEARNG